MLSLPLPITNNDSNSPNTSNEEPETPMITVEQEPNIDTDAVIDHTIPESVEIQPFDPSPTNTLENTEPQPTRHSTRPKTKPNWLKDFVTNVVTTESPADEVFRKNPKCIREVGILLVDQSWDSANWKDTMCCFMAPSPPKPEEMPTVCRDIMIDGVVEASNGAGIFTVLVNVRGSRVAAESPERHGLCWGAYPALPLLSAMSTASINHWHYQAF
ncbi:hypothetical protein JRO89_XS03G0106100 [Xanthoceras sorbifolium]|uniref:Uncharacterized protein n=1 Tax=Xanthoceras sorbifolium TaxID=99658 RepID=A0ABQ8I9Y9_9ROSI|nr:hypothetical protein JRO89_XS03G0106100 [Xanthoceras sorbifolium]